VDTPDYLLRVRCAERKVTNAYPVMMALARDGDHIEEKDHAPDRYKTRKRKKLEFVQSGFSQSRKGGRGIFQWTPRTTYRGS
jgi:hypothetical protein